MSMLRIFLSSEHVRFLCRFTADKIKNPKQVKSEKRLTYQWAIHFIELDFITMK